MSGIRISEKHGVNPCLVVCFFCNKDKNEIALLGKLKGDVEGPHRACLNMEPCDECKSFMKQGVILISCKDSDEGSKNPYKTGGWIVVKEEVIDRMVSPKELAEVIKKKRVAFVPDEVWDALGLPRGEVKP